MIGQRIAQYEILEQLGEGGMGVVYRAEDSVLRREVALKLLHLDARGENDLRMRLLREARTAAALIHPSICAIYEVGEVPLESSEPAETKKPGIRPGTPFIAMELARGRTLQARLAESGVFSLPDLVSIGLQIAEGLAAAHAVHIVHRDLKPSNVMVDAEGRVKILDFGLAKPLKSEPDEVSSWAETRSAERSREGTVVGTVAYMSPEQALGKPVDSRSDVFAFGILLYEMASGIRPFRGESATSTIAKILESEPSPLGALRSGFSPDVERIVGRCLEKSPGDRFNDTRDLVAELKSLQKKITSGETTTAVLTEPVRRTSRWFRGVAWSVVGAALAAVGVFVAFRVGLPHAPASRIAAMPRQITFVGDASGPAISPDGQSVAYVAGKSPKLRLMTQDVAGGQAIQLYETRVISGVRWSPDGSRLLFLASPGGAFIVHRLGGEARPILGGAFRFSWSGDGNRVVGLLQPQDRFAVTTIATGETQFVPFKKDFTFYNDVDWSGRLDLLVISTKDDADHTVFWTIRPDGSQQQRILESDTPLSSPRWSHTDDVIYYLRGERSQELWKVAVTPSGARRGDPVLVMPAMQEGTSFELARDGKRMTYVNAQSHANLHRVDLAPAGSLTTNPLTEGTLINTDPNISPDGTQIAFARGNGQTMNIFTMPLGGGPAKQLTFLNSLNGRPAWSPDGQRIAFGSMEGGKPRVSMISAAGGAVKQFTRTQLSGNLEVVWAPFSRISYERPGNRDFHLLDPNTEDETPLVKNRAVGWIFQPRYSPRGDQVVANWNRLPSPGLWLLALDNSSDEEASQLATRSAAMANQIVGATAYRDREIRMRGQLKSRGDTEGVVTCYLRVYRANEQPGQGAIDQKKNGPVRSNQWTPCEIIARVDADAETIQFGAVASGPGRFWIDAFEIHVKDSNGAWQPVAIVNPGFEDAAVNGRPPGWSRAGGRQSIATEAYEGKNGLRIENTAAIANVNVNLDPIGWSPDGTRVYAVDRASQSVVSIPSTGGNITTVFTPTWSKDLSIAGVTLSPDTRQMVYALREGKSDIWIVDNFDPDVR